MNKRLNRSKRSFTGMFIASVILILTSFVACNAQTESELIHDEQPSDEDITQAVQQDLRVTRGIDDEDISVETMNGIVTLTGETDNILTKDRATRVSSDIKGVRSVVNNIFVNSERSDMLIQSDVKAALMSDPATEAWEIETIVDHGVATLNGVVDSFQEKELAETVVKGVEGIAAVDNNIQVSANIDRTDQAIQNDIVNTLAWNTEVDDGFIVVNVQNDTVALSGSVSSLYEKKRATALSYVQGVADVTNEELSVESWMRDDMEREDFMIDKSDEDIEKAMEKAFKIHPRVNADAISAEVEDGVVTLRGTLTNLKAAREAAQIANHTHGVVSVENQTRVFNEIVVTPSMNVTDEAIEKDLIEAMVRDPYVDQEEIDVKVTEGVVILNGTIDSYFERYQADDVASKISGVVAVENNLEVSYDELVYTPGFYSWNVVDFDYDYAPTAKTDNELKESVRRELNWSPFVQQEQVEITVEDGVVTLNGTVLTMNAVVEATEEAYEAGAVHVYNNLDLL